MICFELGWKRSHQSYDPGYSLLLLNDLGGGAGGNPDCIKAFFSNFTAYSQSVMELLLLFVKVGKFIHNVADMEPISHTVLFFLM